MNIDEEIEKLKNANELRDEIKVVEEQIYELECDPYDVNEELYPCYEEYLTFLTRQKDRLEEMKSKHKTMSQEIRDYYKKIIEQDEFYIKFPSLKQRVTEDPYLVP